MTKAEAIHAFYSSFGIPAYEENSVPHWLDDAHTIENQPPFLTYEYAEGWFFGESVAVTANIWDLSDSWDFVTRKSQEIAAEIGHFKKLPCDQGYILVTKGSPYAQNFADGSYKRKYMNLYFTFVTN